MTNQTQIANCKPCTKYELAVRAVNSVGTSDLSSTVQVTTVPNATSNYNHCSCLVHLVHLHISLLRRSEVFQGKGVITEAPPSVKIRRLACLHLCIT